MSSPALSLDDALRDLELPSLDVLKADLAKQSLPDFIRQAWPIVEPQTPLVWNWHLDEICDVLQKACKGELFWPDDRPVKRIIINIPPGLGKALDDDTPILTTWGWKTHGELQPGDFVFGPDGLPKRVLACTESDALECCEVEFDEGSTIVASKQHLWEIDRDVMSDAPRYSRCRKRQVVETSDLRPSGYKHGDSKRRPDRISLSNPIQLPDADLLIDPYLLGVWIGDGFSNTGCICCGEEDIRHFETLGRIGTVFPPNEKANRQTFYRIVVEGLSAKLRVLGLLKNKHIPKQYLLSSIRQRMELLRGLMDTDGHCTIEDGRCSFSTKNKELAESVRSLVCSLGLKPTIVSREAKFNEKSYGIHHLVYFTSVAGIRIFNLDRKQNRIKGAQNSRSRCRYVSSITDVGFRLAKCIQVEGNIYLAGKSFIPTHNSLIVSVFLNAWEWADDASLRYLTASYSDDNTIRDNRRLRSIIVSDWYKKNFNVQLSSDQAAKIRFDTTKSGWRIATSIGGMGRGEHPHRVVIDDPHKDASSVAEMEQGIKWADGTLSTRIALNPIVFLIMQRLHLKDLSAHFLGKGGWYHVAFPMRYVSVGGLDCECHRENPDPRDHRKEDGELLWPEQWPEEKVYQEEIDLGPFGASGQLGQKPVPEGGGLFKREWFEIVDVLPNDLDFCRGWDTAESDDAGDWTVGVKLGKSRSTGMIYVADAERERKTLVDTLFKRVAQSDGVRCKIREGAGAGKAVTKARSILLQGYDYGVSPETDSKIERANPFRAQCEMGNVKVLRAPWNEAYLSVVTSFPVGKYDDDVDASSNAFNELVGIKKVSVVWGRKKR